MKYEVRIEVTGHERYIIEAGSEEEARKIWEKQKTAFQMLNMKDEYITYHDDKPSIKKLE